MYENLLHKCSDYYIKYSGNKYKLVCVENIMVVAIEQKIPFRSFHVKHQWRKWCKIEVGTCLGISLLFGNTKEDHFGKTKNE